MISALYNVNPLLFGQTNNFISKADNYGTQTKHWNGVEISFRGAHPTRPDVPGWHQHGTDDHRQLRDPREAARRPGAALNPYCHVEPPFGRN